MSSNYKSINGKEFWEAQKDSYKTPKTKIRITLPAGDNIKLLNLAEISAPQGATIVLKLPFPMGESGIEKLAEPIRACGGTVEIETK